MPQGCFPHIAANEAHCWLCCTSLGRPHQSCSCLQLPPRSLPAHLLPAACTFPHFPQLPRMWLQWPQQVAASWQQLEREGEARRQVRAVELRQMVERKKRLAARFARVAEEIEQQGKEKRLAGLGDKRQMAPARPASGSGASGSEPSGQSPAPAPVSGLTGRCAASAADGGLPRSAGNEMHRWHHCQCQGRAPECWCTPTQHKHHAYWLPAACTPARRLQLPLWLPWLPRPQPMESGWQRDGGVGPITRQEVRKLIELDDQLAAKIQKIIDQQKKEQPTAEAKGQHPKASCSTASSPARSPLPPAGPAPALTPAAAAAQASAAAADGWASATAGHERSRPSDQSPALAPVSGQTVASAALFDLGPCCSE